LVRRHRGHGGKVEEEEVKEFKSANVKEFGPDARVESVLTGLNACRYNR
jgi:hypothetical protein